MRDGATSSHVRGCRRRRTPRGKGRVRVVMHNSSDFTEWFDCWCWCRQLSSARFIFLLLPSGPEADYWHQRQPTETEAAASKPTSLQSYHHLPFSGGAVKKSCSSLQGMIYSQLCWFLHENQVVVSTVLPDIQWLLYLNDKLLNLCAINNKVLQDTIICHLHYTPNLNHLIHKQTVLKWILHKDTAFVFYAPFHTTLYGQQDAQNSKLDLRRK